MRRISYLPIGATLAAVGLAGVFLLDFRQSRTIPVAGIPPLHSDTRPAQVTTVPGTDLARVTLTERATQRLGIMTVPVVTAPELVVPYAAVIYDTAGGTWVYTNPEPLVYVRHRISVGRITGERAILSDGPPAGTLVVTTGAAELFGAEFGVGK